MDRVMIQQENEIYAGKWWKLKIIYTRFTVHRVLPASNQLCNDRRLQKWIGDSLLVESPFPRAIIATTLAMFNRQYAERGEPYSNLKVFEMSRATTWH